MEADITRVPLTRIPIPPIQGKAAPSFDVFDLDQEAHLLYVADRTDTGIDIFDVSTPTAKYLKTVDVGSPPNGLMVAKNVNKIFTGNNDSTVAVIDVDPASPRANTVITRINTGGKKRADEMDYEPKSKKLYIANSDNFVTVIDAVKHEIIKKIDNAGQGLEQVRYNPADGLIYVPATEDNALFVVDPSKDEVVKKLEIGTTCEPHGVAINPTRNQMFIGCGGVKQPQQSVLFDLKTGKVVTTFPQLGAGDAVYYSAKADRFFFAAQNFYRGPQLGIFGGSPVAFITNVPTGPGSHSVAYDEANKIVYTGDHTPGQGGLLSFPLPK